MGPKFQHARILDDKILTIKTFINLKKITLPYKK